MKKTIIPLGITVILLLFSSVSCTNPGNNQKTEISPSPLSQATATNAVKSTETVLPTATPEPVPCTISFDSDRDGNLEIYRMAPDGSDLTNLSNHPADDSNPAWSPDGSQIAFVSNRDAENEGGQAIYVMNADGSNVRQLTFNHWSNSPDWSHDGTQITYSSDDDIFIIQADGSGQPLNLTNSPEKDEQPAWSPDGSQIAWLSGNQDNRNIFIMNSDGTQKQQLTQNGKVNQLKWTIDGQIFSDWQHPEGLCNKCVMNSDGSNLMEAGGKGELQRFLPFKTLDGDRVECVSGNFNTPDEEIFLVGEIFPDFFLNLTNNPAYDRNPDWPSACLSGFEGAGLQSSPDVTTEAAPSKQMVIGYAGDQPEQKERAQDLQTACDELGIQCVYGDIPKLIEQGVDAIIQNTDNSQVDSLQKDLAQAREKQIPVFLLDAETDMEGVYSISIDHDLWAETSVRWLFEKMDGKGEFAYFDLDPARRYSDTIKKLLKEYPGISVVEFRDGAYDPGKIKPETSDFVKMYPDLKAIWSSTSNFEAMWGLEENGIPYNTWPFMVCEANRDGLLTWERIQAAYPDFDCFASVNPPGIAYAAVYAAFNLENGFQIDESALGGEFGHTLFVNLPTVTKDNYQEKLNEMKKYEGYIVDDRMTPEEILEKWFLE